MQELLKNKDFEEESEEEVPQMTVDERTKKYFEELKSNHEFKFWSKLYGFNKDN